MSDPLSVPSLSSQEDGGGPAPYWPRLSQDLPDSTPPPDGSDAVRGDVSDHQHFHLLQWIQQTRVHISRGGSLSGEGRRNGEVSSQPLTPSADPIGPLRLHESMTQTLKGQRQFRRPRGRGCIGHIHTITMDQKMKRAFL